MAWHTAICLLLIHGPISCMHTPAYRCRPARLQANKLDCVPDICNPALLLTKVGSTLSYVGHLSFITQIPIELCGGATFEYGTVISAGAFHMWFSLSSNSISSQNAFNTFFIMYSEIELHVRIKMRRDCVESNLMDAFSGKYHRIRRSVKQQSATPLIYRQFKTLLSKLTTSVVLYCVNIT